MVTKEVTCGYLQLPKYIYLHCTYLEKKTNLECLKTGITYVLNRKFSFLTRFNLQKI